MFGRGQPDLITALITPRKDRSFEVQYIGDDSGAPLVATGQLLYLRCLGC